MHTSQQYLDSLQLITPINHPSSFMANQSSLILRNKLDRQATHSKIAIGLSKSLLYEPNKLGFSGNHHPLNMDSTRVLGPKQDLKRRCFEKLVVEDVKCALEAQVIDDTALIEATVSVNGFKNRYTKQGTDGRMKRNKGVKKLQERCSMKCPNEKKLIGTTEKKVQQVKGQKGYPKMAPKVKLGYQKKGIGNPEIFGETMQETDADVNLNVSVGIEKELTTKLVEPIGIEKELATKLVETEADTMKSNPIIAVHIENNEPEYENVHENTSVGSKKVAYSREELEALRSVDEEGQKSKWVKVYSGFAPSVAREYTALVVDASNRLTQRYTRVANCGSTRGAIGILNVPPVLPLCSPSHYM